MANEERTEQATPHKRQEAREKGQVAKSIELSGAVVMIIALLALRVLIPGIVSTWQALADTTLRELSTFVLTDSTLRPLFLRAAIGFFTLSMPMLLIVLIGGIAANVLQSGFLFSTKSLAPDFARMNPFQGLARIFSQRSVVDIVKSLLKAALIIYVIYAFFRDRGPLITAIGQGEGAGQLSATMAMLCWEMLMRAAVIMAIIAVGDYAYQRWQFEKTIRMTKQEVKEEYKRTEGDPLIRSRMRARQREIARNRMMAAVPQATVILTNPTHLAVALRYEPGKMDAPTVIAKGQRLIAEKIKEIAREHGIPIIENKPIARALYEGTEIGDEIPADLYQAVAEIIAFVYRQSGRVQ